MSLVGTKNTMVKAEAQKARRRIGVQIGALFALVMLLIVAVYPAIDIPFVLDDHSKIVLNRDLHTLVGLWDKLIYPYGPALVSTRNDPSRPLVYLIYTLAYAGWGPAPVPFHVINFILHGINGLLILALSARLYRGLGLRRESPWLAWISAAFFLLAPINTATVAYIYGLSDVLSLTWILCALLAHSEREKRPIVAMVGTFVSTVLALATKQIAVLTPLLLVLCDGLVDPGMARRGWRDIARRYAASVLPVVLYLIARILYFGRLGDLEGTTHVKPLSFYVLAQAHAILHYIAASFVPVHLCLDHDLPYPPGNLTFHLIESLFLSVVTLGSLFFLYRKKSDKKARLALFGILFLIVWLAPTSSLIPTVDYVVERRIYGGTFGLAALMIALLLVLRDRLTGWRHATLATCVALGLYAVTLVGVSHTRLAAMQDEKGLWQEILARYPLSYRALGNLANAYVAEKKFAEAAVYYQRILRIIPDHSTTYINLAFVYAAVSSPVRDLAKARMLFERGLQIDPNIPEAWQNLGLISLEEGHFVEAERYFRKVIELDPRHLGAYNQLCALMLDQKKWDEARIYLETSKALMPTHPMVIENAARMPKSK